MDLRLNYDGREEFLTVRLSGLWPSGSRSELLGKVIQSWHAIKSHSLLMDCRGVEDLPSEDDPFGIEEMARLGFGQILRLALVDVTYRHKANLSFEPIVQSCNLNLQFFDAMEPATKWLRGLSV